MKTCRLLITWLLFLLALPVQAQPPATPPIPDLNELEPEQRRLLEGFQQSWQDLSPAQQQRVIRNIRRWQEYAA